MGGLNSLQNGGTGPSRVLSLFRFIAHRQRFRGMYRLGSKLYDPFGRDDDYVEQVCEYGDGVIQIDTRSFIEWWIYMYGSFEGSAISLLGRFLEPSSVVADVGANVGVYTLDLARKCHELHAFEPHPVVRSRLAENVRLNNLPNVRISPYALSNRVGKASLFSPTHANQGQSSLEQSADVVIAYDCDLQTFDNYAEQEGLNRLDLIKVDVEGAEMDVLRGAHSVLESLRPLLYIEVNPGHLARFDSTPTMLRDYLHELGYHIWVNRVVERNGRKPVVRLTRLQGDESDHKGDHYWLARPDAQRVA